MKIEVCESLLLSWLRHIKGCQLTQTNWKPSLKWELQNTKVLQEIMRNSANIFNSKKDGFDLYKKTKGVPQLLKQAEIGVIGVSFDKDNYKVYAIDVAFHKAGLNYGSIETNASNVIKKCIRTAMCIYGYFGYTNATIIFASPKISSKKGKELVNIINEMTSILRAAGLNYEIKIIANEEFRNTIIQPVEDVQDKASDTAEPFMRSLQLHNLCKGKPTKVGIKSNNDPKINASNRAVQKPSNANEFKDMKIGEVANKYLRAALESGKASKEEIERLQTKEYSKEKFHLQYQLLLKKGDKNQTDLRRYYKSPLTIFGEKYYLCSQWVERPDNNDRPYLEEWLKAH